MQENLSGIVRKRNVARPLVFVIFQKDLSISISLQSLSMKIVFDDDDDDDDVD